MSDIRKNVIDRLSPHSPDCGDNSCRFAQKKGGMRTNGGCHCMSTRSILGAPPFEKLAAIQSGIINELLNEIDRLKLIDEANKLSIWAAEEYFKNKT